MQYKVAEVLRLSENNTAAGPRYVVSGTRKYVAPHTTSITPFLSWEGNYAFYWDQISSVTVLGLALYYNMLVQRLWTTAQF